MGEIVSVGGDVIDWIEHYLVHGPGDVQGQPVNIWDDTERAAVVLRMYRLRPRPRCVDCHTVQPPEQLVDEAAPWRCWKCSEFLRVRRAFNEYLLSRRKGWSKSGLAGQVGACEFVGPCRFDGWDAQGRPVARPVRSPFIRCLATEESQSGQTFRGMAYVMHPETCTDEFRAEYGPLDAGRDWQTSTRIFHPDGGEVRPSTASSAAKDGGKETHVIADETHLYVLPELIEEVFLRVLRDCAAVWLVALNLLSAFLSPAVASFVMFVCVAVVGHASAGESPYLVLLAQVSVGAAIYCGILLLLDGKRIFQMRDMVIGRRAAAT
jgi:hypothetical protein